MQNYSSFKNNDGIEIVASLNASVSCGTLRTQDLVTTFLEIIRNTEEFDRLAHEIPARAWRDVNAEYWDSEDAHFLLSELFDLLNEFAPPGYYFGSLEGDGADFGFWREYEENDIYFNN
jgi:hypothetical protein